MSDDDSVIDKFWGAHISAEKPLIYSLTGAQLSVTIVSLKAPTGTATLTVETPYSDAVAIAHLSKANPSSRVDLNFFPTDAQVTFTVTGATVALAGSVSLLEEMIPEDSDSEEEESTDETEAAAVAPEPAAAKSAKRKSREEAPSAKKHKAVAEPGSAQTPSKASQEAAPTSAKKKAAKASKKSGEVQVADEGSAFKKVRGGLQYKDTVRGTGKEPTPGHKITVKYSGRLTNGVVFDSNNNFSFRWGTGQVIKGWDVGIKGMKVGGKRQLVVPPKMGYGAAGAPPVIPSNATLVFEVELLRC